MLFQNLSSNDNRCIIRREELLIVYKRYQIESNNPAISSKSAYYIYASFNKGLIHQRRVQTFNNIEFKTVVLAQTGISISPLRKNIAASKCHFMCNFR